MRILPPQSGIDNTQWRIVECATGKYCVCKCSQVDGKGQWQYAAKNGDIHMNRVFVPEADTEGVLKGLLNEV